MYDSKPLSYGFTHYQLRFINAIVLLSLLTKDKYFRQISNNLCEPFWYKKEVLESVAKQQTILELRRSYSIVYMFILLTDLVTVFEVLPVLLNKTP